MPKIIPEAVIAEAIRLRVVERLSIDDIRKQVDMSVGSLSKYLAPYPLTAEELHERSSLSACSLNAGNHPLYDAAPEVFRTRPERTKAERRVDAVAAVSASLAAHGYTMESDASAVHLRHVVTGAGLRVRIRTALQGKVGRPRVTTADRIEGKTYLTFTPDQCDVVAAFDPTSGHVFVIPVAEIRKETVCRESQINAWPMPKKRAVRRARAVTSA